MQIELFACHYANKSNGASHRDNAAVVNEPPRSASGGASRIATSRHFFRGPIAVGSPRQVADEIALGESRSRATAHGYLLIARVPSLRADNTGEEVEKNVKFIVSERESEGRRICLTISFHHLRTTTSGSRNAGLERARGNAGIIEMSFLTAAPIRPPDFSPPCQAASRIHFPIFLSRQGKPQTYDPHSARTTTFHSNNKNSCGRGFAKRCVRSLCHAWNAFSSVGGEEGGEGRGQT